MTEEQQMMPISTAATAATSPAATLVSVRGLGKRYEIYAQPRDRLLQSIFRGRRQFFREFWALSDVTFEVLRGETVGIVGRNGSGKSTLLQLIAGTLTPTTGTVSVNGRIAALLELGSGFNAEFSGRENIYLNGAVLGLSRADVEARVDAIVAFAGLAEFIDQPIKTYSSGMLMRLAFAVAVNVEPDVLIIDEALAVGDAAFQLKCLDRLDSLTRSGVTLLFVSHDIALVKTFCGRAVYLERGRVKAIGIPEDVAELYALDVRREEGAAAGREVGVKKFVGDGAGMAFGTDEGHIVRAGFAATGGAHASGAAAGELPFHVDVEFESTVANPALSVIVQDRSLRNIGARYFALPIRADVSGKCRARLTCRIGATLGSGLYAITLRLESRRSPGLVFPIDKQVGALLLEIVQPDPSAFQGNVDLGLEAMIDAAEAG
jgi:lipopolysaccharide transport system ATP-binding protein